MKHEYISASEKETRDLGEKFAHKLQPGDVVALYGNLGTGKTHFVQGLAQGLGITRRIISPTFVVMRTYEVGIKNFYHIDLYRINKPEEVRSLGLLDLIKEGESIIAIEWAEKIAALLPKKCIEIKFEYINENKRKIVLSERI